MDLPTPYYDQDGITIYHADCADILPTIDPADVDLLLTDPPYGININTDFSGLSGTSDWNRRKGHYQGKTYQRVVGDESHFDPTHLTLPFEQCVLFGANHFYDKLPAEGTWHVWDKRDGLNSNMMSDFEVFWSSFPSGPSRLYRHKWLGYMRASEVGEHLHPTQKPTSLMVTIVDKWTQPGDLIFDPYMGSGPVAQACHVLGRRYIGVEIVEDYCQIAVDRLAQQVLPLGQ